MSNGLDIQIEMDVSQLVNWDLVPKKVLGQAMRNAASTYMVEQRRLVGKGKDVNGRSFAEYSLNYWSKKKLAGRMNKNYWLRLTGQMFRSQKVRFKRGIKYIKATIEFEGMHTPSRFTSPYDKKAARREKAAYARTSRSQRGGFAAKWSMSERTRRLKRTTEASKLTVNLASGEKTPNSFVAWQNDRRRPFVGMSKKTMRKVWKSFGDTIKRG